MQEEIKVSNKIISIDTIKEIAIYLQGVCQKYTKLIEEDKAKNETLDYADRQPLYDGNIPHIEYTIELLNGKKMTEREYEWFLTMLEDSKNIKCISFKLNISFFSGKNDFSENSIHKTIYTNMDFYDNRIYISVDGKELRDEVQRIYSDLRAILDICPQRYNKTIKNRNIRMQSFYFNIGLVFTYVTLIIIFINIDKIPAQLLSLIQNKYIISAVHMAISIILGNVFGSLYMNKLYENILPERRYSHYSEYSQKSVYVDDVNEYIEKNEVQIGKFYNSIERRNKIESIYKSSKLIVLVQIAIYLLYIFIK